MKPATKYAATGVLYRTGSAGIWEYEIFRRLRAHYPATELQSLREDLVGMNTVGWLTIIEEREHRGQLLRRYALADGIRPFLRFQLRIDDILAFLDSGTSRIDRLSAPQSQEAAVE